MKFKSIIVGSIFILFSNFSHAFDTASFLDMTQEQQTYYLFGIIDREVMEARFGADYPDCAITWARENMFDFLSSWYSENEKLIGEVAVTFLIHMELRKECVPDEFK